MQDVVPTAMQLEQDAPEVEKALAEKNHARAAMNAISVHARTGGCLLDTARRKEKTCMRNP